MPVTAIPDVTFYGASDHSRAVAFLIGLPVSIPRLCNALAFIDDFVGGTGLELAGRPIISWDEWRHDYARFPCMVPIGNCSDRRRLVRRVAEAGGCFTNLYDARVMQSLDIAVGAGTILCSPGYIGPNTVIGEHVQIMPMHSIGHDVTINSFATLAPAVTVSGYVTIGEAAYIGAGATIVNGRSGRPLVIGAGAIVAAGAVVTKSVGPGTTVMGNPARPLRQLAKGSRRV